MKSYRKGLWTFLIFPDIVRLPLGSHNRPSPEDHLCQAQSLLHCQFLKKSSQSSASIRNCRYKIGAYSPKQTFANDKSHQAPT